MTLRIITGAAAIARNPVSVDLARSVRHACAGLRFNSLSSSAPAGDSFSVTESYKPDNRNLFAEAERAQTAISELYAFREKIADLRELFESLRAEPEDVPLVIEEIEQILRQQPASKIVMLYDPLKPDVLLKQAWEELNGLEVNTPKPKNAVARALVILDGLNDTAGAMLSRNEKLLRNTVIARENVSAGEAKPDISMLLELCGGRI